MAELYVQFGNGITVTYQYLINKHKDELLLHFYCIKTNKSLKIILPDYIILENIGFNEQDVKLFMRFSKANSPFIWELARVNQQLTIDKIKEAVLSIVHEYHIEKVILFGSHASGKNTISSDVDLIVEFKKGTFVSLLTISSIKNRLEEILHVSVDIIHGPIKADDMLEIDNEVILYAA